ncbi:MAG: UDP-N-acetylmuramoyl-L-alanyl-D-glutamate--2,6-diaminopimelate ligase [Candidatus Obscuribacter phosphatis]|uniref:UDP-N-acetylmuramyl-tripeptide synthetase n=1 Tax=Candidatus Obscuribacter phosphatis TaxID=1906157 RepID=A0A8J7PA13_9BACT|nr:UDP-N-acetylmuramoyl-L-alanyl-D-glutamate--2,6-diaminopimelate ligase [Candidatus Obscuribacter phosphatis]
MKDCSTKLKLASPKAREAPLTQTYRHDLDEAELVALGSYAGVTADPKLCKDGFIYVADVSETVDSERYGLRLDGRDYIGLAVENGASLVLTTSEVPEHLEDSFQHLDKHLGSRVKLLRCREPLRYLGPLAQRIYCNNPPAYIALVTGTNGKTSTVNFARQLWHLCGLSSCSIGNLGAVVESGSVDTLLWERDPVLSVPETVTLHKIFARLAEMQVQHVAMEATSHALFDHRLDGVKASHGVFTNLTHDHLDFHGDMNEYFRVKMTLFDSVLAPGAIAVLNADADWFDPAAAICRRRGHEIVDFGRKGKALTLLERESTAAGETLQLRLGSNIGSKTVKVPVKLRGLFQIENILAALSVVLTSGVDVDEAVGNLAALSSVEGRLELVAETDAGAQVLVDYAHTPDGLARSLQACRGFTAGRLILVFGCNGDRDAGKRPEMGRIAVDLADSVIVTDGHPRSEDPEAIRGQILEGAKGAIAVAPRTEAIRLALEEAVAGDTVLIAGFGHENFQVLKDKRVPYSDKATVQTILESERKRQ